MHQGQIQSDTNAHLIYLNNIVFIVSLLFCALEHYDLKAYISLPIVDERGGAPKEN